MQQISIIGRIGKNAEVKDLGSTHVINFSVCVSETFTKNETKETKSTWFEISKFGNNTAVAQYIKKGDLIFISGKPNNRAYAKDDSTIQVINGINAFEIELLGSKSSDSETSTPPPTARPQANMTNSFVDPAQEEEDVPDLPF